MPKLYDYDAVEKQVELISKELEPKIVKEICRELKLSSEYERMTTSELHRALGLQHGFCYVKWHMKKKVLKRDYGINWKSPSDLNPEINFD